MIPTIIFPFNKNKIRSKDINKIRPKEGNETFCMAPWVHTHSSTQGERKLCCIS